MKLGIVGLGRMGLNMALRLQRAGHDVIGTNRTEDRIAAARQVGIRTVATAEELVGALEAPRTIWAMIPAGDPVDDLIDRALPLMHPGDLVVDGGNSNWKDSRRRGARLAAAEMMFADAGTSGGVWGLELGYCIMVGGAPEAIARLAPALDALAPEDGWRHVGAVGAGHFAKMVHNGIEYGMMQAYGEGFELLHASEFDYDLARVAQLWNRGSVVRSWLLELVERAFLDDPKMEKIRGYVDDSGEGRWTVQEAIDHGVPAPVLAVALFERFRSRQEDSFRDRVIASLRHQFGGHAVKAR
jgi:6-phosphogluconate dehydrogenase